MKLTIWKPFDASLITQPFAGNANPLYHGQGLKGHTGIDYAGEYGTPIPATVENAYVYSLLNKDNPNLGKYRGVCTIWDDKESDTSYEVIYGHCSKIIAKVGTYTNPGDIVALVGNTGDVYANGNAVTIEERNAGSHAGSHLHFQVRALVRVKTTSTDKQYLYDGNGLLNRNGSYYEVVDYTNGYNGCVDPSTFFNLYNANQYTKVVSILMQLIELLTRYTGK